MYSGPAAAASCWHSVASASGLHPLAAQFAPVLISTTNESGGESGGGEGGGGEGGGEGEGGGWSGGSGGRSGGLCEGGNGGGNGDGGMYGGGMIVVELGGGGSGRHQTAMVVAPTRASPSPWCRQA